MNIVKGLKSGNKSHHEYQSVEDQKDLRIPIQNEDAFKHGIVFKAKYIGTQEITRPSNRVEIVSAMRRIRYEYKYRNIKKRKVNVEISVNGIKVTIWKKKKNIQEGKYEESQLFVMCYPINRVFYVSHDSQDLLILSYIARGDDGIFRCSVFKAFRKAQAMGIVRTIGQAFEVCHKLNQRKGVEKEDEQEDKEQVTANNESDVENNLDDVGETDIDDIASPMTSQGQVVQGTATVVTDLDQAEEVARPNFPKVPAHLLNGKAGSEKMSPLTLAQLQQTYHQQLAHQAHEVAAAKSEVNLLKQQLKIEMDSRVDAQSRVEQLLAQNRELLVTVQKLMSQLENVPAKDLFDPVDETWMISSFAAGDCFLPARSLPVHKNDITNDCLSSVYDNQHHQSMDFGPSAITSPFPQISNKAVSGRLASDQKETFHDLQSKNPLSFVEYSKDSSDSLGEIKLSEDIKEGYGGLSTSFSDLRTIGTGQENIDLNHNKGHITKFSTTPTEDAPSDNGVISAQTTVIVKEDPLPQATGEQSSVFSKEMMETFSEEINELDVLIPEKGDS